MKQSLESCISQNLTQNKRGDWQRRKNDVFHKNIDKYLEHSKENKDKIKNFDSQHQNIKN